jgi:hypothetical protein
MKGGVGAQNRQIFSPVFGIRTPRPPPFVPGGGAHSLAGEGGGPNSDAGTYTIVLYVYTVCTLCVEGYLC